MIIGVTYFYVAFAIIAFVHAQIIVPDISLDPYIFESDRLPRDTGGNILLRYMPSIGNGHVATNVYTDAIYVNGLYTGFKGWSYRAKIPSIHASSLSIVDENDPDSIYRLDTKKGIYEEEINGTEVSVYYRTYAHHYYNRVLVTDITLIRTGNGNEEVTVNRTNHISDNTGDVDFEAPQIYNGSYRKSCGNIVIPETETSGFTPICMYWTPMPQTFTLQPGENLRREIFIISLDGNETVARQNFDVTVSLSGDELLQRHAENWNNVWENGVIEFETDDLILQKVVIGSFYYLYSNLPSIESFSENYLFYGLSPGGLSNGRNGSDYYGHVFWDMETWMYPSILYFRPDLAKEMLSYRIHGMDPAFDRAHSGEYTGTRFPWESAYTGVEVTPDICVKCRENQQHITGDIAFAARQYISATRDVNFLTKPQADNQYTGFNFIRQMANFWFSRPSYNTTKDKYEINGVMPPDEHQEEINNSVYTNLVASLSIHFARYAACLAGEDPVQSVPDRWINVAENLHFPYLREKRYHEEFEGYDQQVMENKTDPRGIKQADVILLGFPLLWDMPGDVRQNDLITYEEVTNPAGPAMTWGMYSIGWQEIGNQTKADDLFRRSYSPYYREPFKIWTETQQGVGAVNFITGMGGFLQAIISGYGGLRLHVEELVFKKHSLPPGANKMTFKNMKYLGNSLSISFEIDIVKLQVTTGGMPLTMQYSDNSTIPIIPGVVYNIVPDTFKIYSAESTNCELPKDFIDVNYDPVKTIHKEHDPAKYSTKDQL